MSNELTTVQRELVRHERPVIVATPIRDEQHGHGYRTEQHGDFNTNEKRANTSEPMSATFMLENGLVPPVARNGKKWGTPKRDSANWRSFACLSCVPQTMKMIVATLKSRNQKNPNWANTSYNWFAALAENGIIHRTADGGYYIG